MAWAVVACAHLRAEPVKLAPEQTILVVAKSADKNEQDAARMLQTWLRKANAATTGFEIKSDGDVAALKDKIAIAVGNTSLLKPDPRVAKLNDDGFLIHRDGSTIAIEGHTSNAAYYGAVAFLDRYAGVRFYMPGDLWTSLQTNHEVVFDGGDFISQPFVISGFISGITTKDLVGNEDWLRRNAGSRRKGGSHQHDLWAIFPPDKFAVTHPEIYPIYAGQRYIPKNANDQSWQVDFTEPATLEAAKESITDYFKTTPGATYIAVSINDSNRWSESERNQQIIAEFKAKYPQEDYTLKATSDIYWRFMNELAPWMQEKFPDKRLLGLAYGPTRGAPSFKLADNIIAFTVMHIDQLPVYDEPLRGAPPILGQWLAVAHYFGNHDWYEGDGYLFPRIYSNYWSKFLRELAEHMDSAYMHAEAYPNWGFDGPKYYVMAKMWWNPQADPSALTRQFCDDMFGPAAGPMVSYFEQLEILWNQLNRVDGPARKLSVWSNQFTTTPASRAIIQQCHDLLQQAAAVAQTDDQKKRIALFSKCFAFSENLFALAEKPTDETLHQQAVSLAEELVKDKWTVYKPTTPLEAIQAIYKGPAKPAAAKAN